MSSTVTPPAPGAGLPPAVLVRVLSARATVGFTLLGLALALLIWLIVRFAVYGLWAGPTFSLWLGGLAGFLAATGIWASFLLEEDRLDHARVLVLLLGGVAGLWVAFFGIGLLVGESMVFFGETPLAEVQTNSTALIGGGLALLAGLSLTFVTLLVGRGEERRNALLRRLLYGYNAVLSLILLLIVLFAANLFAANRLPTLIDFTENRTNSLDPEGKTRNVVRAMTRPVTVYVLMTPSGQLFDKVQTLLENVREINRDKITIQYVSVDTIDATVERVEKQYGGLLKGRGEGLLVAAGDTINDARFISEEELESAGRGNQQLFQGESKLVAVLSNLTTDRKTTVYFVGGNGGPTPAGGLEAPDPTAESNLRELSQFLTDAQFEPKILPTGAALAELARTPDDQPRIFSVTLTDKPLPDETIQALRLLLDLPVEGVSAPAGKRNGRLVVTIDGTTFNDAGAKGIDRILAEFGIERPTRRVLAANPRMPPYYVPVRGKEKDSEPLARAFAKTPFFVTAPFEVQTSAGPEGRGRAIPFLWTDSPPTRVVAAATLRPTDEELTRLAAVPLTMAALGTDADSKPRVAVVGSSSMLLDDQRLNQAGKNGFEFVVGVLNRMRDREAEIGAAPRVQPMYKLDNPDSYLFPVLFKPVLLLLTAIIGLGGLIYIVRNG